MIIMKINTKKIKKFFKDNYAGYLAILPLILGIFIFSLYPVIETLVFSFHDYNVFTGELGEFTFKQYEKIFATYSERTFSSLGLTFAYTAIMVSFNMVVGFALALWVNSKRKGMGVFKILLYLPCLVPAVISGLIWQYVGDVNYGIGNAILTAFGFEKFAFLSSASTSFKTIVIYSCFGVSSSIFIWLSSLKSVPVSFYEAAEVEGCGAVRKLFYITIPMCTPFILYNLLTNLIATIQTFTNVYTITGGNAGVQESLLFYVIYIYKEAFELYSGEFAISYASALSWVLFVIIAALSGVLLKTSKWVYYNEEA